MQYGLAYGTFNPMKFVDLSFQFSEAEEFRDPAFSKRAVCPSFEPTMPAQKQKSGLRMRAIFRAQICAN